MSMSRQLTKAGSLGQGFVKHQSKQLGNLRHPFVSLRHPQTSSDLFLEPTVSMNSSTKYLIISHYHMSQVACEMKVVTSTNVITCYNCVVPEVSPLATHSTPFFSGQPSRCLTLQHTTRNTEMADGFWRFSVAPARTATKEMHRCVMDEVPNAATNEAWRLVAHSHDDLSKRKNVVLNWLKTLENNIILNKKKQ